jgi:hypothetical protein
MLKLRLLQQLDESKLINKKSEHSLPAQEHMAKGEGPLNLS